MTSIKRAVFLFLAFIAAPVLAADQWPQMPINLIVPYPAGGSTDELARMFGQSLEKGLGQTVIIQNKPGASGAIGASYVAKSKNDGYTLLLVSGVQVSVNPLLYDNLPYDPKTDFSPIILATALPSVVVVNPQLPVNSISELIAYLRAHPSTVNYGSASTGTPSHLGVELFKKITDTSALHVPYKGGAPALVDLMGGQVSFMFAYVPEAAPYVESGKLRALAVTTKERLKQFPSVPTMIESGIPNYELLGYYGIVAPKGTPDDRIHKINQVLNKALADPANRERLVSRGFMPLGSTEKEFGDYIDHETQQWTAVIKGQ
jgi:tripartite-type tricarboxylate transporter receptor subunit TctC